MKKIILSTIMCVIFLNNIFAQANDSEALLYNVGIGAVFGSIGALINKKPGERIDKVLLKGFSQGSLGGYVTFESKRILRESQINEDWKLVWLAKIVNAGGTSIKENAAMNRNFWEFWHINIGFNRLEFTTNGKFAFNYKLMPLSFVYTTDAFFRYRFDLNNSLKFGEFIFSSPELSNVYAYASAGHIVYDKSIYSLPGITKNDVFRTAIHEIIHVYQANDFLPINTFYIKYYNKLSDQNKTFRLLTNSLYLDLHYIPLRALYLMEKRNAEKYYDNFFEHEAGYFSNTLH